MTVNGTVSYAGKVKRTPVLQSKNVDPSGETQVLRPDHGYDGISKVVVDRIRKENFPEITPENIKEGVEILDVVGTLKNSLQSKTVSPIDETQIVEPDSGYSGLSSVTVQPVSLQTKTVAPSAETVAYYPDNGYTGFSRVTVSPITADISPELVSSNIKSGVSILGVEGTFDSGFEVVDSFSGEISWDPDTKIGNIQKLFKDFSISKWITTLGTGLFKNCTGLESISIPVSVTSIGQDAFYGCTGLTDVYYGGTLEQWNAVDIGSGNAPLLNADIHYQGG